MFTIFDKKYLYFEIEKRIWIHFCYLFMHTTNICTNCTNQNILILEPECNNMCIFH